MRHLGCLSAAVVHQFVVHIWGWTSTIMVIIGINTLRSYEQVSNVDGSVVDPDRFMSETSHDTHL